MKGRIARLRSARSALLILFAGLLAPAQASAEGLLLLAPPLDGDLAAWPALGMAAGGADGGASYVAVVESERSLVWIGHGPRLLALAAPNAGGNGTPSADTALREVGRSPALPGVVRDIAIGDGFALLAVQGRRDTAWLLDISDPSWPRAARRLRLSANVRGVALHGAMALVATDSELVQLRIDGPARAVEVWRTDLQGTALGPDSRWLATDGTWAAIHLRGNLVEVFQLATSAAPRSELLLNSAPLRRVTVYKNRLCMLEVGMVAQAGGTPGTPGGRVPPRVACHGLAPRTERHVIAQAGPRDTLADLAIDPRDGSLWLVAQDLYVPTSRLLNRAISEGGIAGAWRRDIPLQVPRYGLGGVVLLALADDGGEALAVTQHRSAEWLSLVGDPSATTVPVEPWSARWIGSFGTAQAGPWRVIVRVDGMLELSYFDADHGPKRVALVRSPLAFDGKLWLLDALVHGDRLWVAFTDGLMVFDVSHPADIRSPVWRPNSLSGGLESDGGFIYVGMTWGLGVYRADAEDVADPITTVTWPFRYARVMHIAEGHLWVGEGAGAPAFLGLTLQRPYEPRIVFSGRLPTRLEAIADVAGHLALLHSLPSGSLDLAIMDIAEPTQPHEVGRLDLGIGQAAGVPGASSQRTMVRRGSDLLIAHPGRGVLHVDLRVPSRPDEVGWLDMPGEPDSTIDVDDRFWATSADGGIAEVRIVPAGEGRGRGRVWLPVVSRHAR